jgi:tetratricopeptide (TPR) repeat protein
MSSRRTLKTKSRQRGARRAWLPPTVFVVLLAASAAAAAPCTLGRLAELPVTMAGMRPLVHAAINGQDALFLADSGAFYSVLSAAAADEFKLTLHPAPFGFDVRGIGGDSRAWTTEVQTFTIFGLQVPHVGFFVLPNDIGQGAAGVLGQNIFRIGDVEYDLANGVIRLMRPHDCKNASLAYWAAGTAKPVSEIDIDFATPSEPHTKGIAYVNGTRMRVTFDTGASTSYLTLDAARRAGVTPQTPGVESGGTWGGIGPHSRRTWIAPFASFRIGDEEVRNTRLRIGEGDLLGGDMLLGADFFLSHHVYVASSQHKLYFTYNGGPVFNLTAVPPPAPAAAAGGAPGPPAEAPTDNLDAAALARRGAASTSRHDYEHALADLTRAIAQAPTEPSYLYERGEAYLGNKQPDLALADFDQAIKLKPDDVPTLVARAELRASRREPAAVVTADLDAADHAAPRQSDVRIRLGDLYEYEENLPDAIGQYSTWIEAHERDEFSMPRVLNSRCWARALMGQELDRALADCNKALHLKPDTAAFLDSRGLVYLRQGNYERAITDYDASLKLRANAPWVLYCRGIAKQRKGPPGAGKTDMDTALAQQPGLAARAAKYGINP